MGIRHVFGMIHDKLADPSHLPSLEPSMLSPICQHMLDKAQPWAQDGHRVAMMDSHGKWYPDPPNSLYIWNHKSIVT